MITERTLRKWRKDSLKEVHAFHPKDDTIHHILELHERILKLTQELMDLQLLRRSQ